MQVSQIQRLLPFYNFKNVSIIFANQKISTPVAQVKSIYKEKYFSVNVFWGLNIKKKKKSLRTPVFDPWFNLYYFVILWAPSWEMKHLTKCHLSLLLFYCFDPFQPESGYNIWSKIVRRQLIPSWCCMKPVERGMETLSQIFWRTWRTWNEHLPHLKITQKELNWGYWI